MSSTTALLISISGCLEAKPAIIHTPSQLMALGTCESPMFAISAIDTASLVPISTIIHALLAHIAITIGSNIPTDAIITAMRECTPAED